MDMDINTETTKDMEYLIEKVRDRVNIQTKSRTGMYSITFQDENPQLAKRMVQTLLDIFVEDTLGDSAKDSDNAISFLDKQISKYDVLLQQAEERLEDFKKVNVGVMPKDGANYYKQLQEVTGQYEQARLQLRESSVRRDKLKSQLDSIPDEKSTVSVQSQYENRIRSLEAELEELLLIYTDAHPDVLNKQRILESLYGKKSEENDNAVDGKSLTKFDNPVYQQIHILLSETEANISSLTARTKNYQDKIKQLKKVVDIVPKIEAELKRLNRDYEVHKTNYIELVERREQAKISEDVETGTEQVKFKVIEPPRVPAKASFPNRPLFDFGVLVIALGIGYGIGLLISLAKPVFYNTKELGTFTGLAVLGAVMKFDTAEVLSKRKRNVYLFVFANILLLAATAVIIFLHSKDILILSKVLQKLTGLL
jgi:polysaccharide chain length determinant protein (PEP-CTERM system associated)